MLGVFTDCLLMHVVTGGSTKGLILWGQGVLKSLQYGVVMGDWGLHYSNAPRRKKSLEVGGG
jgi:hypothetical protein